MKSFFLLFILAGIITVGSNAQSLQLLNKENEPIGVDTLTILAEQGAVSTDCYIHVKNISSELVVVRAKKIIVNDLEGSKNMFCWGGMCYPPNVTVSPLVDTIDHGKINDSFHATLNWLEASGSCKIMYVFFNVVNPDDSVAITVTYKTDNTGINDFDRLVNNFTGPFPNPAVNSAFFRFSFTPKVYDAKMVIYSQSGCLIKETVLNKWLGEATVNTCLWPNSIYLYSLIINDKVIKTGKLTVNH